MDSWRIEYLERPLKHSWIRDFMRRGSGTHGFLRLVDNKGAGVLELHGLFTNELGAVFNTAARMIFGWPMHFSRLKVLALTNPHLMNVCRAHLPVTCKLAITGSEDTILRLAEAMVRAGDVINENGFDYYVTSLAVSQKKSGWFDPGLNCKTVAIELLRPFVEPLRDRAGHFENPTLRKDLATVDPVLSDIHVDWESRLEAIRFHLATGIREISPKHGKEHLLSREPLKDRDAGTLSWLRGAERRPLSASHFAPTPVVL